MLYLLGRESELLHFIEKAKARRPAAVYPAPTKQTPLYGRYYLSMDAQDWPVLGSLESVDTLTLAQKS